MKLVIFDCDGTLVDSQHAIVAAMEQAFRASNLAPPPRPAILNVVGLSLDLAVMQLMRVRDPVTAHPVAERYKDAFAELRARPDHDEPLFPGCRAALDALVRRDDVLLGIATGKSRRGVAAVLEREGWQKHFATIQTADGHPSKPHPSMVLKALAETGVEPDRAVMVGDTSYDIEMARAADVAALGVSWGYHPVDELREAGADLVIDDYAELSGAIDSLLARTATRSAEASR